MNLKKDNLKPNAGNHIAQQQCMMGLVSGVSQRDQMLNHLKNQRLLQKSKNITLETVKQTFITTDFVESKKKSNTAVKVDESGLIEDESDDSDYDPNKVVEEDGQKDIAIDEEAEGIWDDEENYIDKNIVEDMVDENEEEGEEEQEVATKSVGDTSILEDKSNAEDSDEPKRLQRRRKDLQSDKASEFGKVELKKKKKEMSSQQREQLKKFFDEEAELGSDDEDNDHVRKQINKDDQEENEDGQDDDLQGFVVQADDVEIGEAEHDAMGKYLHDLEEDDKANIKRAMEAAIFGRNRKRQRGEVEGGFEDQELNDYQKRKQDRLQEREQLLNSQEDFEELQQHLLEGGKARALEHLRHK